MSFPLAFPACSSCAAEKPTRPYGIDGAPLCSACCHADIDGVRARLLKRYAFDSVVHVDYAGAERYSRAELEQMYQRGKRQNKTLVYIEIWAACHPNEPMLLSRFDEGRYGLSCRACGSGVCVLLAKPHHLLEALADRDALRVDRCHYQGGESRIGLVLELAWIEPFRLALLDERPPLH